MAFEKQAAGGIVEGEEQPFAVALFYPSEVKEIADEMGVRLSPNELNAFCDAIADEVIDSLGAAMLDAGEAYIKRRLAQRRPKTASAP